MKKLLFNISCGSAFALLTNAFLASKDPYSFVRYCATTLSGAVLLAIILTAAFFYFKYLVPLRRREKGFPYVYIEKDGTVRKLSGNEMEYLCMEFSPGDGGRPNIKFSYAEKNGWGNIDGFIPRRRVPARFSIARCFSTIVTISHN